MVVSLLVLAVLVVVGVPLFVIIASSALYGFSTVN